jgi:hypothetical protein
MRRTLTSSHYWNFGIWVLSVWVGVVSGCADFQPVAADSGLMDVDSIAMADGALGSDSQLFLDGAPILDAAPPIGDSASLPPVDSAPADSAPKDMGPPPPSDDASLVSLVLLSPSVALSPSFTSANGIYRANVPCDTRNLAVVATASHPDATFTINGYAASSGSPFAVSIYDSGSFPNPLLAVEIVVTAASGKTQTTIVQFATSTYLKASNTEKEDIYGVSVDVAGDTIVVGAKFEDSGATGINGDQADNTVHGSGAVYVLTGKEGIQTQQAYLKPTNAQLYGSFGGDVALDGNRLVVGARGHEDAAGAAFVFLRQGTQWTQEAELKASNPGELDIFGQAVAISGDTIVVGANQEDSSAAGINGDQSDNLLTSSGAAYVFRRQGIAWVQEAYLKASNPKKMAGFGVSVAIAGDTIVVGAHEERSGGIGINGVQDDDSAAQSGAAYVFVRQGGAWSQEAYFKASNAGPNDYFGRAVSISGNTIVVGAPGEESSATAINGDQADDSDYGYGAAYVFVRQASAWSQQAYLKAPNSGSFDEFGGSVSIDGEVIVVGAKGEASVANCIDYDLQNNDSAGNGAAYVFIRQGNSWMHSAYLKASNAASSPGAFGTDVAVSGSVVIVGAPGEDSAATGSGGNQTDISAKSAGAVYVFD